METETVVLRHTLIWEEELARKEDAALIAHCLAGDAEAILADPPIREYGGPSGDERRVIISCTSKLVGRRHVQPEVTE